MAPKTGRRHWALPERIEDVIVNERDFRITKYDHRTYDCVIETHTKKLRGHKAVLGRVSAFFNRAFYGPFRISSRFHPRFPILILDHGLTVRGIGSIYWAYQDWNGSYEQCWVMGRRRQHPPEVIDFYLEGYKVADFLMMPVLLDSIFEPIFVYLYLSHQKLNGSRVDRLESFTKDTLLISDLTVKIFDEGSSMAYRQLLPFFLIWFYELSNYCTYCMREKLYASGPLLGLDPYKRPESTFLCPGGIKIVTGYPTMSEGVIDA